MAPSKLMKASICLLLAACMAIPLGARGAEPNEETFVEVPPPPPPPSAEELDEAEPEEDGTEPEVTIIQRRDATYEEYRLNGRLYMVKVVPFVGPPYYYVDRDGDGLMETRMNGRTTQPQVPQWVIFSW
jgi:hypothetical protein